jgi:hypothetical protein
MEEIDILKKLKISNGVNGLSKEGDLLSEIIKVKYTQYHIYVWIKHNRSLKVAVQGLDFMAQPLYIRMCE